MQFKRVIFTFCWLCLGAALASAQPLWVRQNCISPDGKQIAFSYQGDIFIVPTQGGKAVQLTSNPAYDADPIWTPDGSSVVFSSMREKSKDIFIISAQGGSPDRLTAFPGAETPLALTPDGQVIFSANIQYGQVYSGFPEQAQVYSVPCDKGLVKPSLVTPMPMSNISVNASGSVLYEDYKGYEDPFRKHHTSSVTRDIWYYKSKDGKFNINENGTFTKLSNFEGEDRNPVFGPDGDTYYYISEKSGSFNIWKSSLSSPSQHVQITSFDTHPVRYISVAQNGQLCFSYDGELYVMTEGSAPQRVDIQIVKDSAERAIERRVLSGGAGAVAPSPNEKEVALVARGDVWVTSVEYGTTKRITKTAEQERNVCFSPDGKTIYYSSERDGFWGIYATSLDNKDDKYFTYATKFSEKLITTKGETCFQGVVSPDGEWIAFLRNRTELVAKNLKSGKEKSLLKDVNYSYQDGDLDFAWSPDSQYLISTYQANGGWNNPDVALVELSSGKVTNLTQSGYSDGDMRWALGGKAMTWQSDKLGYRSHGSWGAESDIYLMFFDGEAYMKFKRDEEAEAIDRLLKDEKEAKKEEKDSIKAAAKLQLDLAAREDRIVRLTPFAGRLGDYYLNESGTKLFYTVRSEQSSDLCVMDVKKGDIHTLSRNTRGSITPSQDGKYIYLTDRQGITRIDTESESKKHISFSAEFDHDAAKEREYIFNHIWKQVLEKFYDPDIHGIDWAAYKDAYAKFLPYINNNNDFKDMLAEMLGELNGSHTGARYRPQAQLNVGHIGVLFEQEGMKIAEVLPSGPLHTAYPEIEAGDEIVAVDGEEVDPEQPWYNYFENKVGKRMRLTVAHGKKEVEVFVVPAASDDDLMYKRWVRKNEEYVAELSGGRVGYVHVEGMNSSSFREVYSKLLGKYRTCEAVVVDTRHNGGGWLHDDLATLLGGKAYLTFEPRGQYIGTEPYSKWTKPSCVLMGEDNYSDACGFPYTYRALGIGKLIGAPVPGTMTAVWWEYQVDPTMLFGIPQVGSKGIKEGRFLENLQIEPDILVYNDPASELRGEDPQLKRAVEEMLKEISK